ncbi:MAG: alpha/beta fold hydrolase [Myxococcales bacterium]|nr:alpha/beta fold hydrolase [Myxococcales bacterium]
MSVLSRLTRSTRNALELVRLGKLGPEYSAPYDVVDEGPHHKLRRYATRSSGRGTPLAGEGSSGPSVLLVPPLMVASEIYDIEAELSAVAALGRAGITPYLVDFGAPERSADGLLRNLTDHVKAVARSIERVRELEGRDTHVVGYSQGGMFAYQAVAYVRSRGVRSIVTFGSPVDIHKNLPAQVRGDAMAAFAQFIEPALTGIVDRIGALPGKLTSTGFKVLSTKKEIQQRFEFLAKLHDRNALVRREARRRFLGGEGFVAWPGPALRDFVDEFIVHNRMISGGFLIDGRTVTLADIVCPILCFVGTNDEIARAEAVRAIVKAAPEASVTFVSIEAGHFGLVVGSRAMLVSWPTVAEWVAHREGVGPAPRAIAAKTEPALREGGMDAELDLLAAALSKTAKRLWRRIGDASSSAADALDGVRYQEPQLRALEDVRPDTVTNPSKWLAAAAKASPQGTFFLFRDRAFTYEQADARVTHVVKGLYHSGVRPGDRVLVVMESRPSYLSLATALIRLGAVPVLAPPDASPVEMGRAAARTDCRYFAADPRNLPVVLKAAAASSVLVLGATERGAPRAFDPRAVDMEAIDPAAVTLPADLRLDAGRALDLGAILLRPADSGELRAAPVTFHRWALSAHGAAAACTLKPADTVYSCIPLHHPAAILVAVGAALVAGARLALGAPFSSETFFSEVRRYGATVIFYAGEMLRPLVHTPPKRGDRTLPVRMVAGSGMRPDLWEKLEERFNVGVLEFYASTTQRAVLANASGEKLGAVGRPLPGSAELAVVKVDLATGELLRDVDGHLVRALSGEPGLLAMRQPAEEHGDEANVVRAAFGNEPWVVSSDVVREDSAGDVWFVDSRAGFVATHGGAVSLRSVEDALYALPEIELACAFAAEGAGAERVVHAAFVSSAELGGARLDAAMSRLPAHARPRVIAHVPRMPLTDGYRPKRRTVAFEASVAQVLYRLGSAGYELAPEPAVPLESTVSLEG